MTDGPGPCGLITVAGPAVEHRSAVARGIVAAAGTAGIAATHERWEPRRVRPGLGWRFHAVAEAVRFRRTVARWRRVAGGGLVVVAGSWFDLLLGSRPSRLPERLFPSAMRLAVALPRSDLVVIVDEHGGDRPRPPAESDEWPAWTWTQLAWAIAPRAMTSPPHASEAETAEAVLAALAGPPLPGTTRWVRVPLARRARDARATVGADTQAALGMFQPRGWSSRVGMAANAALLARGVAPPVVPPVDDLAGLCAAAGIEATAFATIRSSAPGRRIVAVAARGRLQAVLKVGPPDDEGLRREADALVRLSRGARSLPVPLLLWSGAWAGRYVIAISPLPNRGLPRRLPTASVVDVCVRLFSAAPGGSPVVHGDVARWNFVGTPCGLGLVDWENARFESDPLYDLAHFVVQEGAVLGRLTPDDAVDLLVPAGSAGASYLGRIGLSPDLASGLVESYLARAPRRGPFHLEMERRLQERELRRGGRR